MLEYLPIDGKVFFSFRLRTLFASPISSVNQGTVRFKTSASLLNDTRRRITLHITLSVSGCNFVSNIYLSYNGEASSTNNGCSPVCRYSGSGKFISYSSYYIPIVGHNVLIFPYLEHHIPGISHV